MSNNQTQTKEQYIATSSLMSKVSNSLQMHCEKEIIPKYTGDEDIYVYEHINAVIDYSLKLAEVLHLNSNICYAIAIYHELGDDSDDKDNNYDVFMKVTEDRFLVQFFTEDEIQIIASACKEHIGMSRNHEVFTSLYSKVLADANTMSLINIDYSMKYYWNQFVLDYKDSNDAKLFDMMYNAMKSEYGIRGKANLILKASYDIIKDDWMRAKTTLESKDKTQEMFLHLVKFGQIRLKNDGSLQPNKVKRTLLVEEDEEEPVEEVFTEATKKNMTKREQIEALIYKVLSTLDVTGVNVDKYKKFFGKMSDEVFNKYMKAFLKDEDENFYLEILPNKNEPSLVQIKKALDILKVPTDEYVYLRHDGHKDDPIRTAYKVAVGYTTIKRVQQILSKKNTYSLDIAQRNMKNGQVTGADKIARISDIESYSLVAIGADNALKEFLGPRADNSTAKVDMYKDINLYGYTYLKDMGHDITENQTLNTIYIHLLGAGLSNDLLKEDTVLDTLLDAKKK